MTSDLAGTGHDPIDFFQNEPIRAMQKQLTLEEVDSAAAGVEAFGVSVVDRILDRALRDARLVSSRNAARALSGGNPFNHGAGTTRLSNAIARALTAHYSQMGRSGSARIPMEGGGISFHFDHKSVSQRSCILKRGQRRKGVNTWGKQRLAKDITWTSGAGAHQIYIERPDARDEVEEWDGARVQRYIDDPDKVLPNKADSEDLEFSFGNLGWTAQDRALFWELAFRFAERGNGIIQHRFIVQLPKEATARERQKIMKDFVAPFDKKGMRYWVALHAPTDDNDPRNFHAHVVLYNRPARKVDWIDPAVGSGVPVRTWDFACSRQIKTKCRHTQIEFPHRQKVPSWMRGEFVVRQRRRFASCVNFVMRSAGKGHIKYDARSYEAAGVVVPETRRAYDRNEAISARQRSLPDLIGRLTVDNHAASRRWHGPEWRGLTALEAALDAGRPITIAHVQNGARLRTRARQPSDGDFVVVDARSATANYVSARLDELHLREKADIELALLETTASAVLPDAVKRHRDGIGAGIHKVPSEGRERTPTADLVMPDDIEVQVLHDAATAELHRRRRRLEAELAAHAAQTALALDKLTMSLRREERARRTIGSNHAAISAVKTYDSRADRSAEKIIQPSKSAVHRAAISPLRGRGKGYGE